MKFHPNAMRPGGTWKPETALGYKFRMWKWNHFGHPWVYSGNPPWPGYWKSLPDRWKYFKKGSAPHFQEIKKQLLDIKYYFDVLIAKRHGVKYW